MCNESELGTLKGIYLMPKPKKKKLTKKELKKELKRVKKKLGNLEDDYYKLFNELKESKELEITKSDYKGNGVYEIKVKNFIDGGTLNLSKLINDSERT